MVKFITPFDWTDGCRLPRPAGFQSFPTATEMFTELRRQVMVKMIRQAHEAELAEPGEMLSAIVGTPEW